MISRDGCGRGAECIVEEICVYDAVEWAGHAGHTGHAGYASHRYGGYNGQFVVRSIVPLQRYERGHEPPHPRPLHSLRVISLTRGGS